MEITLAQLAERLDAEVRGGDAGAIVRGIAGLDTVGEGEVTYVASLRHLAVAEASPALALIAPCDIEQSTKPLLRVKNPQVAFAAALGMFDWRRPPAPGIDPTAIIDPTAEIDADVYIGPYVVVGARTAIGAGCAIHPHVVIAEDVRIGAGTILYPQVTIYARCAIGSRVMLHAGVVIGADGFGYERGAQGLEKIPQIGIVIIEDDVEIGANTTVDRAKTGATVIGRGTKIDNLVQIGHNCKLGERVIFVSQSGIAGSSVIEDDVLIAGQVGINDHVRIGKGAMVAGRSGVTKDLPPGITVSGYPAQPHHDELRYQAALHRVPELLKQVKELERRLAELETREGEPVNK
ncbi:MAG: UDP-3-O-(3-hydroxymyristoyl)glucosamine N-acyltransferase [Armatimonadota bacterium]